jgi:acetyl/propionyl-CoA carboxylase alpha subunit
MFTSVLVANRGEIACRIFRTAKRMGMQTVAVYSDADAKAKHVREADRAVGLGPPPAAESYLRGDLIIAAAREAGAQAIHPGYGFLSENPEFAEAVVAAGLIWIGPTPAAIRAMGLKDEAKRLAIAAGVPVLEGYQGEDQSEKRLLKAAKDVGLPVLIKAVAGGGGRGIREVTRAEDFKDQLASAQREAKAAFGNDAVLIERLVQRPRHIEVQVFGDKHGEVVHLFERDCSLQRRRQKVIEEAPAPGMTEEVRAAITHAAVKLARAVAYENAGTVEFIVDGNGPLRPDGFWFLEMNTRLQVEHPVTEMITGQDLVEWQFRVAAGEKLPKRQDELTITGHAIEARICAEDPAEGFRPSVGSLVECHWVSIDDDRRTDDPYFHRNDSGFEQGDTVPSSYDSLIAKAICWSSGKEHDTPRAGAICGLTSSLSWTRVRGVSTNIHFLIQCLKSDTFNEGAVHVGLIGEKLDQLTDTQNARLRAATDLVSWLAVDQGSQETPWTIRDGWRLNAPKRAHWCLEDDLGVLIVDVHWAQSDTVVARSGGVEGRGKRYPGARELPGKEENVGEQIRFMDGMPFIFRPPGASAELHAGEGGDEVKAPLPGKIVAVAAKAGQGVKKGDVLLTLEAMKMEHGLKAPRDGIIAAVSAKEGAQVKEGAVLVKLEPEG